METWSLPSITAPGLLPHPRRFERYYRVPVVYLQRERQKVLGLLGDVEGTVSRCSGP